MIRDRCRDDELEPPWTARHAPVGTPGGSPKGHQLPLDGEIADTLSLLEISILIAEPEVRMPAAIGPAILPVSLSRNSLLDASRQAAMRAEFHEKFLTSSLVGE